jgi:N-acetylglucosaminyl-diphospho-decaprenol L-rhamnosyltransferase
MQVRVCIVGFRSPDDIVRCIDALAAQSHQSFEVVVCENGGQHSFDELRARLPATLPGGQAIQLIADHDNPGYAGGINNCIEAKGLADAYWVLNPDTLPEPDALAAMVARLQQGDADAIGGRLVNADGTLGSCGGEWIGWLAYARSIGLGQSMRNAPSQADVERKMKFISGASLLSSRRFIDVTGLMRSDYFLYCEEVEWCLRATSKGMRLGHCPEARVVHHQGSSTGSGEAVNRRGRLPVYCNERNRILTLRDTQPWLLIPGAFGALATIFYFYGKRRAWRQLGFALTAWTHGLLNRRGKPDWL